LAKKLQLSPTSFDLGETMILAVVIGYLLVGLLVLAWAMSSGRVSSVADRASSADFRELVMRIGSWRRRRRQRRSNDRRLQLVAVDEERRSDERRTDDRRSDQTVSDLNAAVPANTFGEAPLSPRGAPKISGA
jgi:hypothetical protein